MDAETALAFCLYVLGFLGVLFAIGLISRFFDDGY